MPKNDQKRSTRRHWQSLGYRRCYCGKLLNWEDPEHPDFATIEHLVPKSRGGTLAIKNSLLVCKRCNESRSSIDWYVWVETNKPPKSDWLIKKYDDALLHFLEMNKKVDVKIPDRVRQIYKSRLTAV